MLRSCAALSSAGSKRLMATDEGREELRAGTYDLDATAKRLMQVIWLCTVLRRLQARKRSAGHCLALLP